MSSFKVVVLAKTRTPPTTPSEGVFTVTEEEMEALKAALQIAVNNLATADDAAPSNDDLEAFFESQGQPTKRFCVEVLAAGEYTEQTEVKEQSG